MYNVKCINAPNIFALTNIAWCACVCAYIYFFVFVYLVYHGFHYGCGCVSFALRWLMSPFDFENVNLLSSSMWPAPYPEATHLTAPFAMATFRVCSRRCRCRCRCLWRRRRRRHSRWRWRRRLSTCQLRWLVISIWIIKLLLMRLLLLLLLAAVAAAGSILCGILFSALRHRRKQSVEQLKLQH